ncbi:MAG: hypothetical protein FWC50_08020 [Planctomycetaceae bacterium]|nr:hypothetical protein [Planctomycetaceae bacterium]
MSGELPVSPKSIKYPVLQVFRISTQPTDVETVCIFLAGTIRHNIVVNNKRVTLC